MRLRRLSVVVATLSVVVAMAGCMRGAPPITDEQVEAWRAMGEEMVPLATQIEFEDDLNITMLGSSDGVVITVTFATFADLNTDYQAVADLGSAIDEQTPDRWVSTHLELTGNEAFESEAASRLLKNVPGLEDVYVNSIVRKPPTASVPSMSVTPYFYLENPRLIDPTWLDNVADLTHELALDAGGRISSVVILPADAVGLDIYGSEIDQMMIPVQDLPAFADLGGDGSCLRTENWAYDVTNDWVIVHPAGEPEGACA